MCSDPEYDKWLIDLAKDCRCCQQCSDVPCAGLMAGGFCDEICDCDDDWIYDLFDDDMDDEFDDD